MITFEKDEQLIATIRRHWFVLLAETFHLIILILLPMLFIWGFGFLKAKEILGPAFDSLAFIPGSLVVFFYSLWILVLWVRFFVIWTDYYLDCWFVTNERIIDVEQRGFFSREVSSIGFDRIQDITIEVHGMIATFFDFGDLHVQSAGEAREFVIRGVPKPYHYKEVISRARTHLAKEALGPRAFSVNS